MGKEIPLELTLQMGRLVNMTQPREIRELPTDITDQSRNVPVRCGVFWNEPPICFP
jgi:hypothetical protein